MPFNKNYRLVSNEQISEINSRVLYYRHIKTGARVLSVINEDENKVFGITFRTPPENSNGVAHIMEHSVLCGSRKYPVKEPFVELLKGSLNTFLNAMTYPDKTCYPVASTNLQDFYNLVDVYLDAVFFPRITPQILQQEGWHYELDNENDPLKYKGVVYNEMKGSYSSPDRVIAQVSRQSIFPDNTYAVDSGGHPAVIPNLTYPYFKQFHEKYYHPSNAYIFFYGDDKPERRLEILNEYLQEYGATETFSEVALQEPVLQHKKIRQKYFAGSQYGDDKKGVVTLNWLLSDTLDNTDMLRWQLLDQVVLGTPASPLWKALIDSGYGEDLTGYGLSGGLRQLYFSVGLQGIDVLDADKVEKLVFDTLDNLVRNGLSQDDIEASLNTIEFSLRENNTGSTPRGLSLMIQSLSCWLYDADPIAPLAFEAALRTIKEELKKDDGLLEKMIKKFFLDNQHRSTVIFEPDQTLAEKEEAAEKERLFQLNSTFDRDRKKKIVDETKTLKTIQGAPDTPENLAKIPRLGLADLNPRHKPIPIQVFKHGGAEILFHDLFTSGILYLEIGFNLKFIPQRLLPYLRLFGRSLLDMGTEKEDFVKLSQRIGKNTGGIGQTPVSSLLKNGQGQSAWLIFNGKSMVSQTGELVDILKDIFLIPKLDNRNRFRQLVLDAKSSRENNLAASGHGLVQTRLNACFHENGWLGEKLGGINYLFFLRKLAKQVDENWPGVLEDLETLRHCLIHRSQLVCNVTVETGNWKQVEAQVKSLIDSLPKVHLPVQYWKPDLLEGFEGLTIPAQVNFVGKAANLYDCGYKFHGSTLVINKFLRTSWLWNKVRVQGGAYGGFCSFNKRSGIFSFGSYRDPNLLDTIKNYDLTGDFLKKTDLNKDELTKSIIGAISDVDAYQLPDEKGYTSMIRYLFDETDEESQQYRDEILSTTPRHFKQFAEALEHVSKNGLVVVAGSEDAINKANEKRGNWLKVTKIL